MNQQAFQQVSQNSPEAIPARMRRIEGREWWLWGFAVAVTLALTLGIISFTFPWFNADTDVSYWFDLREWVRGLAALVLLFDFYAIYQHMQLHRIRRQLAEREGERMEYRVRHKDGTWRTLESTASPIRNEKGQTDKLVIVNRDITERKRAEEMLAHNAFHDGLTNLPNRALFLDRLQQALTLSKRHPNYKFAVLLIDVDEFKIINDSLGHAAGDDLLIQIGQRLKESVRRADTVSRPRTSDVPDRPANDDTLARLGGDEFTILLDDIRDPIEAVRVAERVQAELAIPFVVNQQEIVISASIGIAASTSPHTHAEDLLRDADIAMYRAKRAGKACCEVSDTAMHENAVKRLQLETDLRKALDQGEFRVYYQPIVSLQTGKITGFEALTRWQRPEGILPPIAFILVAEETGLIIPMNRQLLREACQQLRSWQSEFPSDPPLTMSVNMTSREFAQPDLASEIRKSLEQTSVDPSCLQLEIIETIAMGDAEKSGHVLAQLKALGVRLSIDDFGTGYSSLSRLRRIPVDTLKIDRAFISNMDTDPENREIVRAIIVLEMAQGYFFSRPADDQTMFKLLASNRTAAAVAG